MSKTKAKTAKRKRIDDATLVRAWISAKSAGDAAAKIGMRVESVRARVGRLRKAGVRLPKFRRRTVVDVNGLNKLIAAAKR